MKKGKKGKKGRRNRPGGMNTDTPASPPLMKSPTANPNSKAKAGYGREVGSERPSMLGSKPTPSPTNAPRTFIGKPKIVEQVSVPATIKSPTTNPRASAGAGYGRAIGTERSSLLATKKDVLNSVKKKKPKPR